MPPSVFTNSPTVKVADSVNVVLFDSLNTQQQDQTYVRDQLIKYVNDFPSGRQLAIFVLGSQLRLIRGFTTDFSGLSNCAGRQGQGRAVSATGILVDPPYDMASPFDSREELFEGTSGTQIQTLWGSR